MFLTVANLVVFVLEALHREEYVHIFMICFLAKFLTPYLQHFISYRHQAESERKFSPDIISSYHILQNNFPNESCTLSNIYWHTPFQDPK
jgi:hypothetical protein